MSHVTVATVEEALDVQAPNVVSQIVALITSDPDDDVVGHEEIREGAPTMEAFLEEIRSPAFRRKSAEAQASYRQEQLKALESPDAEVPLEERYRAHEILLKLWATPNDSFARQTLLDLIRVIPIRYGAWRGVKRIFKEAEAKGDTVILGALSARFDSALADPYEHPEVSRETLLYLCRRAWRYLRDVGETLPVCYADTAVDFLVGYNPQSYHLERTWVANHIFFHELGTYTRTRFPKNHWSLSTLKHRAFADLWQRSPRPLFDLLERAHHEVIRAYATNALKTDFRAALKESDPSWVARLIAVRSESVDQFVVWLLGNVPKFEQASFRELGLHAPVLRLLQSDATEARRYAATYLRTHVRDLDLSKLIPLANSEHKLVREAANELLLERDPRKDIGLENWRTLLLGEQSHTMAREVLRKHFGASELTPAWFKDCFLETSSPLGHRFACEQLTKLHAKKELGAAYFSDLVLAALNRDFDQQQATIMHALSEMGAFDLDTLDTDFLQTLMLSEFTNYQIVNWVQQGLLKPATYPIDFLKAIAYRPDWEAHPWIQERRKSEDWARDLEFAEHNSTFVLQWLGDVRAFTPDQLGFAWLLELVQSRDSRYHQFATDTMIKAFLPADFAEEEANAAPSSKEEEEDDAEVTIDLGGQSYLFTGKLATMTRAEAKKKVVSAGGVHASGVTKKLDFLVIGDEGSSLYGGGRKGSKQLKAEGLIEEGAALKIISETAFLQMLTGEQREVSEGASEAGCERLWQMMVAPGPPDAPLAKFARAYFRRHHPDICLRETDRPVDPGAEIPDAFLTFDQVKPIFADKRQALREWVLELSEWEFARWAPPIHELVALCEVPYPEVQAFVAKALTADESAEHRRYRVDPAILTPDAVYSFCESNDQSTRDLGMRLIEDHPRLRVPEELFRLTESPDRNVRAFVIRSFWDLYRDRGITAKWKPAPPTQATLGAKAKKAAAEKEALQGEGAPERPEAPPAEADALAALLRRALFELPPGRPEKAQGTISNKVKPLPARKAKLYLIETLRDLALEEEGFAKVVFPMLKEFMGSRGQSEMAACLVAVTRLQRRYPTLQLAEDDD